MTRRVRVPRAYARKADPETSHAAAAKVNLGNLNQSQHAVYLVLQRYGPCTHEELIRRYNAALTSGRVRNFPRQSDQGIRSRCSALVALGLVEATGQKERISTGNLAMVWRVTP